MPKTTTYDIGTLSKVKRILENTYIVLKEPYAHRSQDIYRSIGKEYNQLASKIDGWNPIEFNESADIRPVDFGGAWLPKYSATCKDKLREIQGNCEDFIAVANASRSKQADTGSNDSAGGVTYNYTYLNSTVIENALTANVTVNQIDVKQLSELLSQIKTVIDMSTSTNTAILEAISNHITSISNALGNKNDASIKEHLSQIAEGAMGSGLWQIVYMVSGFMAQLTGTI